MWKATPPYLEQSEVSSGIFNCAKGVPSGLPSQVVSTTRPVVFTCRMTSGQSVILLATRLTVRLLSSISDNLHRILSADYAPTDEDMMRIYVTTHGSHDVQVEIGLDSQWVITDPGNHVATKPKLWHSFDNVPIILFTVPLSEYDATSSGDGNTGNVSFMDLVSKFRAVCEAPEFSKARVMLLLTKGDLFREKLVTNPLENHFSEYRRSDYQYTHDNWAEVIFLRDLFKNGNSHARISYHMVPTDVDTRS